jgi:hypothetical protein
MYPLQFLVPVEALDAAAPVLPWVILGVAVLNMGTRLLAHRQHTRQAREGDDDDLIERSTLHSLTTVLLLASSFTYLIVAPHGGMVMTVLAVSVFLADFFEFESRRVEARNERDLQPPRAAIGASLLVLGYAGFQAAFGFLAPFWNAIV